eukprot:TRINITY_DN3299_c0_g2_i1.p1 TRINITY_DN3299_c0_g2~~TRINITY_DN3299_c0_g2_i1.p1  ORF type:complete len:1023 (-),score=174.88 TRINITY_DN3299_c0_g2_i1:218-3232(-)
MAKVFEIVVKEGIFSYTTVQVEAGYYAEGLGLHSTYFNQFTASEIASHLHCLIAAKHVAAATDNIGALEFDLKSDESAFFLSTIGSPSEPTGSQKRTEDKVAAFLSAKASENMSLTFMASEGPAFSGGGEEHLGFFNIDLSPWSQADITASRSCISSDETDLEMLASASFLKTMPQFTLQQYQNLMEEAVALRRSVVRVMAASEFDAGDHGFVLLFATPETVGRQYLLEVCQALRFVGVSTSRFYMDNFANGVIIYRLFIQPSVKDEKVNELKRTLLFSTLLKNTPGKSALVHNAVIKSEISHECALYLLAAVKFVYAFFPKEQYAREYTSVHKMLEADPQSQRKLEALYRLCIKDLLSTERIYQLVIRHLDLAKQFFEDFKDIATGKSKPHFNEEVGEAIDSGCADPQDRQILRMFLTFNHAILMTNFFKSETPGAFSFRLDPAVVLKDRPTHLYPEIPYGIYLIHGRDFVGFHTRFRDVARGGIRLILSRDKSAYERNFATLYEEGYNLAFTQQYKNKDIPEGGSKGVILPDSSWHSSGGGGNVVAGSSVQSAAAQQSCFVRYVNALLDCMLPEKSGIFAGHMKGKPEILFFGPDENTAGVMDLGAELARTRNYPYWKALTTGKSVAYGGVPHDTYGMTTTSVHTYVTELLRELGEDETKITKFQTGGPDGDLGSNEILFSKDRTIAIVDGSGVVYDPAGLNRDELTSLAMKRQTVRNFSKALLGPGAFLVTVEDTDVTLPDGSNWLTGAELRDKFHLTDYAAADLFVPCGGRPNAVNTDNVKLLFTADGRPKFRWIVEGANLFFSDRARKVMEDAGVHHFKDASTNKGGVCSSSLEVLAALALGDDHASLMCYQPLKGEKAHQFYQDYVKQIQAIIIENAKQEFRAIWKINQEKGISKVEATKLVSQKINAMQDSIIHYYNDMTAEERELLIKQVLKLAVPPLMIQHVGVAGIMEHVPSNYISAIVGAWVGSRFVYTEGVDASEVSFFFFLRSLLNAENGQ